MQKKMLYIIGIMLLLAGCHNNNHQDLRRAEEKLGIDKEDSLTKFLDRYWCNRCLFQRKSLSLNA